MVSLFSHWVNIAYRLSIHKPVLAKSWKIVNSVNTVSPFYWHWKGYFWSHRWLRKKGIFTWKAGLQRGERGEAERGKEKSKRGKEITQQSVASPNGCSGQNWASVKPFLHECIGPRTWSVCGFFPRHSIQNWTITWTRTIPYGTSGLQISLDQVWHRSNSIYNLRLLQ